MMNRYEKLCVSLRYFLIGKGYFSAVDALEFAATYHKGLRKDGVTREFQHQLEITHYLRTLLPWISLPEETLCTSLLHDVTEDYGVLNTLIAQRYGDTVAEAVNILDKNGKEKDVYFSQIGNNAIASIVKGGDRMHNLQSMVGVFSDNKQMEYVSEVHKYFFPMLKTARRKFASQEAAYENIKHVLTSQCELLQATWSKAEKSVAPQ